MRIRYVAPIIGPLVILAVLRIRNLTEFARPDSSQRPRARRCSGCPVLAPNLEYILRQFEKVRPWSTCPDR